MAINITNNEVFCKGNGSKVARIRDHDYGIENVAGDPIPEWLLVEVLVRLPSKLVNRFKLVSKQWLSVISDPCFVRTYVSRASSLLFSSQQPPSWTSICHTMNRKVYKRPGFPDVYFQAVNPCYSIHADARQQQQQSFDDKVVFTIKGVSNGLVLYNSNEEYVPNKNSILHRYYICNPITYSWFALPICSTNFYAQGCGFLTHVEDGVLRNYTVVRLKEISTDLLQFQVLFSEIGEWKNYTVFNALPNVPYNIRSNATAVDGVLHWIAYGIGIIAYDPHQSPEQVRVIQFPDLTIKEKYHCRSLCAEYKGKLRYSVMSNVGDVFPSFKLWDWVLNDDRISWSLRMYIPYAPVSDLSGPLSFRLLSFHPFDSDVVYFRFKGALALYNMKTKKIEVQEKYTWPYWYCHSTYLLVISPWSISLGCFSSSGAAEC